MKIWLSLAALLCVVLVASATVAPTPHASKTSAPTTGAPKTEAPKTEAPKPTNHTHNNKTTEAPKTDSPKPTNHTGGSKGKSPALSEHAAIALLVIIPLAGFAFAMVWWVIISKITVDPDVQDSQELNDSTQLIAGGSRGVQHSTEEMEEMLVIRKRLHALAELVTDGAKTFLFAEYRYMGVFVIAFSLIIFLLLGLSQPMPDGIPRSDYWMNAFLTTVSFIIGCLTSIFSGWIGMRIAVYTNSRCTLKAFQHIYDANKRWKNAHDNRPVEEDDEVEYTTEQDGLTDQGLAFNSAFQTAFRGGLVMGFALTSAGVFALFITIMLFKPYFYAYGETGKNAWKNYENLYEVVAAFGLGGSSIACFGRVGGGIYTKAADVGADLVGKVEKDIPEDDPRNPGVLADCVGDNVGDIAGMGSDLFGSFGEATCAALVCSAACPQLLEHFSSMMFPLLITVAGLIACFFTSFIASNFSTVSRKQDIEPTLKNQLLISTILTSGLVILFAGICLPTDFDLQFAFYPKNLPAGYQVNSSHKAHWWSALICVLCGLWAGLAIGYITEYYTSNEASPTKEVAEVCETGAATCVIYGLALGYLSVIVPVFLMAATIYVSYNLCLLYGFSLAALGILSTMSIGLTIDAYGPIADNAGGLAEMSSMQANVRAVTDALDAAGNTTAAIGKGFAISSAAMVGLALYGAFVTRCFKDNKDNVIYNGVNIIDGRVLAGLLIGAMLPYWFSALTMKSVGIAAKGMIMEIRRQFKEPALRATLKDPNWSIPVDVLCDPERRLTDPGIPKYNECVKIATDSSLREMLPPGALVMLAPIVCGIFLGKEALAGLLPGSFVSGVQMAISSSNTGGSWDNAKKYVESRQGHRVIDEAGQYAGNGISKFYRILDIFEFDTTGKLLDGLTEEQKDAECKIYLYKKASETILITNQMENLPQQYQKDLWKNLAQEDKQAFYEMVFADFKDIKEAAVIGDTVGDPLKDTSGPALNILMKLMAIISVVFAPVFMSESKLSGVLFDRWWGDFNADPFQHLSKDTTL